MPKKIKYNPADRMADLAMMRMQGRIKKVYAEAEQDITKKLNAFIARFREKDAEYQAGVKAGKIAQADYDAWRRGQIFQGKRWRAMRQEMTEQIYRANKTAAGIINGERRVVFQQNANYLAYQIEKGTRGAVSFGLYDSATVTRLLKEDRKLLPEYKINQRKDYKWNNQKVNSAVTQSIVQGESIDALAKRMTTSLEAGNRSHMLNFARTAMTGAQNAGRIEAMHDAEDMGIKVQKRWIATLDSRTRDTHAELDGQVVDVDKPFEVDGMTIMYPGDPNADPSLVYNCFIGETNIATDSKIIRSYKHDYSGKLIEVETSSGVKFTCTPNHPILTPSGWVPAALMNNGDNLLIASVRNGCGLRRNGNIQHIHARMKALYNALHRVGLMSRDSTLRVDFHGDTPTADVEVITKKWHLRGNGDSSSADSVDKFLLENSDKSLMSKGASVQHFGRVRLAALRFVRGFCKVPAFFGRGLAHAVIHGFGTVARSDTAILEPQADSMTGDMQFLRESLDRFPGKVFVDNIVNINITTVSHIPVYNLQTGNSRYFVNTIIEQNGEKCNGNFAIAHNCRCTLGYEYPGVATGIGRRRDNETGEIVGDMTYREWEEMKKGEGEESTPETEAKAQPDDELERFGSALQGASNAAEFWMNMDADQMDAFNASGENIYDFYNRLHDKASPETLEVPEWKPNAPGGATNYQLAHDYSINSIGVNQIPARSEGWMAGAETTGIINVREGGFDDWQYIIGHEAGHQLANYNPELQRIIIDNPGGLLGRYNQKRGFFDGAFGEYNAEEAWADAVSAYVNSPRRFQEQYPELYDALDGFFKSSPSARDFIDRTYAAYRRAVGL